MFKVRRAKPAWIRARNTAQGSIIAFLEGKKNLKWVINMIDFSGVKGIDLQIMLYKLADYGNRERFEQVSKACVKSGFL